MSTLALSKSPNYNKRTVFWHKIITTLLRRQEPLYSFINSLLSASLLGWVRHMSGPELIWVQEMEGKCWQTFLFVKGCFFPPFRGNWCDQNNVLSCVSNPKEQSWTPAEHLKKITKNKQKWHHKAQHPWVSTSKTVGLKKVIMQLGWLQMKALLS